MRCPFCDGAINNEMWAAEPPLPAALVSSANAAPPQSTHKLFGYCGFCDCFAVSTVRVDRVSGTMRMATIQMVRAQSNLAEYRRLLASLPNGGRHVILIPKRSGNRTRARGGVSAGVASPGPDSRA